MMDFSESIKKELSQELKEKNVLHRDRFKDIFRARYLELMPSLIRYKNHETVAVDFMKLEVALRSGYGVVIGEAFAPQKNNIQVLRSEEHTSELQSRFDLVCRLLLE